MSLYGSMGVDQREQLIMRWKDKEVTAFVSKPMMYGAGINMQQCHIEIFLGINFKANDFLQAIHRIYRFQQDHPCHIHIIYADTEVGILDVLKKKWRQHDEMVEKMTEIIKKYGLSHKEMENELRRTIGVERVEIKGKRYTIVNNDCVDECARMESDSVGLIHTSIPFANHYEYTPCYDEKTEVLTKRGWVGFGSLLSDDAVATINKDTLDFEWQIPSEIVWRPYSGRMLHFVERGVFDLLVTPDHKMFVDTRVGNRKTGRRNAAYELVPASYISDNFTHRKWRMLSAAYHNKEGNTFARAISIPQAPRGKRGPAGKLITSIASEDFMMLAGWYLSEGSCDKIEESYTRHAGRISISQCQTVNGGNVEKIKSLMRRIGLSPRIEGRSVVVHNKGLAKYLISQFGDNSYTKRIPRWVKDVCPELLIILRDTMMLGDGNANGMAYTSYSRQLCDDFQEICIRTGWRAAVCGNVVRIGQSRTTPEIRERPIEVEYSGMIGCATVPNHTLVVRRNGKAIVSGNSYNDFGHTESNAHFWEQMDFLTPNLYRILKPGRIAAIHIKDRILFGNVTGLGFPTCDNMLEETSYHFQKHGFKKIGIITVVTDVVRENNQTYRLGWSEQCKDGSKMGVGCPEYVLLFRKPQTDLTRGYADEPVTKTKDDYSRARWQVDAHAFWRSSGDRLLSSEELAAYGPDRLASLFTEQSLKRVYDYEAHVKIGEALELKGALPPTFMAIAPGSNHPQVWHDVNRMLSFNGNQSRRKLQLHICPLQFDIVDRIITRYSNAGELVFDPFGGLGTVPARAVKLGRLGYSVELNPESFKDSIAYLYDAELEIESPSLFSMEKECAA